MNEKYLIESNGQVYGPADVDQLIQWVAEGRVVYSTPLIHTESGERTMAGEHAELRPWFAPQSPGHGATSYNAPPPQGRAGDYSSPSGGPPMGGFQQQQMQPPSQPWSGAYQPPGAVGYGAQRFDNNNDSGSGSMARLPAELQGMNFGAFAIPIWWGIFNRSYLGLLALIPCLTWIVAIVMLFKGNEWAWQNRRFESIEQFRQVQSAWNKWGIAVFIWNVVWAIFYYLSKN